MAEWLKVSERPCSATETEGIYTSAVPTKVAIEHPPPVLVAVELETWLSLEGLLIMESV